MCSCIRTNEPKKPATKPGVEAKNPAESAPGPALGASKPAPGPAPAAKRPAAVPGGGAPAPAFARRQLLAASESTNIHCAIYICRRMTTNMQILF